MPGRADREAKGAVLFRAVHGGFLPPTERAAQHLGATRPVLIGFLNQASEAIFQADPLTPATLRPKARARQASKGSGLHSPWAQELAYKAADAVATVETQFWKRLRHGLFACDREEAVGRRERRRQEILALQAQLGTALFPEEAEPPPPRQRWTWVPAAIQDQVTPEHFAGLKTLAKDAGWARAVRAILQAEPGDAQLGALKACGLNAIQGAILEEIHRQAMARYTRPAFAAVGSRGTDSFTLQMPIDGRMLEDYTDDLPGLIADLRADMARAWASGATEFRTLVRVKAPDNRQGHKVEPLWLPLRVRKAVWQAVQRRQPNNRRAELAGFSLEIGPDRVEVKVLMALPRITPDADRFSKLRRQDLMDADYDALAAATNRCDHLLSRDINMVNTTAHALVRRDRPITGEQLRTALAMNKEAARTYLGSHLHDGTALVPDDQFRQPPATAAANPAQVIRMPLSGNPFHHSGRNFLNAVAVHAARIDLLRGEIDDAYTILARRKEILLKPLGLASATERIPSDYVDWEGCPASRRHPDAHVQALIDKFFDLLVRIRQLKALRRELYRKIDAIKRTWFGWVTNREVELAQLWNAAVVREDTDYGVIEVDDEGYRGRTFNRVMGNAARGLLERIASAKLAWLGIPELRIPAPYTSSTDWRCALADTAQRDGEVFQALVDGRLSHADENAAVTIALWLLLVFADPGRIENVRNKLQAAVLAAA